jgi:hypothetical protein
MKKLLLFISLFLTIETFGQTPMHRLLSKRVSGASYCSGNTRANNFITATGITDATIKDNICWLVDTLESTNMDDSLYAFGPIVGGTAATHAYNVIDTATYKLTFSGTITHASTGMKGNGSTGYANTGFNCQTVWTDTLGSMGLYSRTSGEATATKTEMGAANAAYTQNTSIFIRFGDTFYGLINCSGVASNFGNTESHGTYIASRYAHPSTGNRNYLQKNTTQELNSENPGRPNLSLYLMAINENGTAKNFSTKELTCYFIGKGISPAGGLVMQKIITSWNTKNSR